MRHPPPPTRFAVSMVGQRQAAASSASPIGVAPPPTRFGLQTSAQPKAVTGPGRWTAVGAVGALQRMEVKPKPVHSGNWWKALDTTSAYFGELLAGQLAFILKAVETWKQSNAKRPNIAQKWMTAYQSVVSNHSKDPNGASTKLAYQSLVALGLKPYEEPPKGTAEALLVWEDMKDQYDRWDGTLTNRGAWWGSPGPGDTSGAKSVSSDAIDVLKRIVSSSWVFQNSMSGVLSFHRKTTGKDDFIYHMAPSR